MCSSSGPCRSLLDRRQVGGEEQVQHRVGHPGRRVEVASGARAGRRAARPPRSARGPRSPPCGSSATSRIPAGISSTQLVVAAAGTGEPARPTALPSASNSSGTAPRRPASGRCRARTARRRAPRTCRRRRARVALVDEPVAEVAEAGHGDGRRHVTDDVGRASATSNGAQVGAAMARGARRARHATSSRNSGCGAVGAALELRMGLRADPERVVGELDELDQPLVGRGAAADEARRPRTAACSCALNS